MTPPSTSMNHVPYCEPRQTYLDYTHTHTRTHRHARARACAHRHTFRPSSITACVSASATPPERRSGQLPPAERWSAHSARVHLHCCVSKSATPTERRSGQLPTTERWSAHSVVACPLLRQCHTPPLRPTPICGALSGPVCEATYPLLPLYRCHSHTHGAPIQPTPTRGALIGPLRESACQTERLPAHSASAAWLLWGKTDRAVSTVARSFLGARIGTICVGRISIISIHPKPRPRHPSRLLAAVLRA